MENMDHEILKYDYIKDGFQFFMWKNSWITSSRKLLMSFTESSTSLGDIQFS